MSNPGPPSPNGTPMSQNTTPCPKCGTVAPPGARFCGYCGTRLPTQADAPPPLPSGPRVEASGLEGLPRQRATASAPDEPLAIQGERREITVLVADVSNFTAASHRMDHEDIYILINEAIRTMVDIVFRYEGSVEHFTGDGLIALFGAPVGHENDPERAVRAALEIQQALELLRLRALQRYNFDLRVRIGIHTGWAIVGKVGNELHTEYTVVGESIQLASYLESQADPGTVLASFATYQRTRPIFHYQRVRLFGTPNGLQELETAFRPLRVREKPSNIRGLPGMQVPLIGREEELEELQAGLQDVLLHPRRTRIIAVIGEAGLGKSRLVNEFGQWAEQRGVPVFEGACLAYGRSSPYWMVRDLIRRLAGIDEGLTGDAQVRELRDWLHSLPIDHDVGVVLPYLLLAMGLEAYAPQLCRPLNLLEGGMLQQRIHVMLRHVLWAILREPAVLVLEDLHWIDGPSLRFLEYFLRTTQNLPLLIILVTRDYEPHTQVGQLLAVAETLPGWLPPIHLQALSEEQSRHFLQQLVPGQSPLLQRVREEIAARAEGNPFYIEEIVRMLIDQEGLIFREEGLDAVEEALTLIDEVPGTLAGLILARFDRLPPALRRTLQQAAVLGRSFPLRLFQALRPGEGENVRQELDALVERHFLQRESFGHEPGYAFRHTLIQSAIYHTLLRRDQQRLHQMVAQAIETIAPEEQQSWQALLVHHRQKF